MPLKDQVLAYLVGRHGEPVSGQAMAAKLGVSRTAVWKAVKSLREDGCVIEGGTNRGYSLSQAGDILSAEAVRSALPEELRNIFSVVYLPKTDSTNNEAKRRLAAPDGPEIIGAGGLFIFTDCQTAGRGRLGRSFASPVGGLYMTYVFNTSSPLAKAVSITSAAAVAVAESLEDVGISDAGIKWVNDVYIDGRKVCGILTEAVTGLDSGENRSIIVGIGINCSGSLPGELSDIAAGIGNVDRNALAAGIMSRLYRYSSEIDDRTWMAGYRRRSLMPGRDIWYFGRSGEKISARALYIDDSGALVVRRDDTGEEVILSTGEVSVRIK